MAENRFRKCEAPAEETALDSLAELMDYPLPDDFKAHYRKHNGGVPERVWWDSLDEFKPCAVTEFYSVGRGKRTIEALLRKLRTKKIIPDHFLPFAVGPSSCYFCLDLKTGSVLHYVTDVFQPDRDPEDNYKKAQRKLSRSFTEFVKGLVGADELDDF